MFYCTIIITLCTMIITMFTIFLKILRWHLVADPVALYTNQSGRSKKPEAAEKTSTRVLWI